MQTVGSIKMTEVLRDWEERGVLAAASLCFTNNRRRVWSFAPPPPQPIGHQPHTTAGYPGNQPRAWSYGAIV